MPSVPLQVQKLSTMVGEEKRDVSKEDVDMEDKRSTDHINQLMRQATSLQKVNFSKYTCICFSIVGFMYDCV